MEFQLGGKKALVLSGSKGIGKGIAKLLLEEGCTVLITSSKHENLLKTQQEFKRYLKKDIYTYVADAFSLTSIHEACDQILKIHGNIDILITNGPGPKISSAKDVSTSFFLEAVNANLLSIVEVCKKVLPGMIQNRFGRIINLTSTTAKEPDAGLVLSNVMRAAVLAYAKTLAREVGPYGVTVNSILTGGVMTKRTKYLIQKEADRTKVAYGDLLKKASADIPVGYIASPAQFAPMVAFLASPLSEYVNGIAVPVDGGVMRGL